MTAHHRDRVILTRGATSAGTAENIPQLPSGRRATANLPGITEKVTLALAVNQTPLFINKSDSPTVPTQTISATSP